MKTNTNICSWCHHEHQYQDNPGDLGTCTPGGILPDGSSCECAGEEAMGTFPEHPKKEDGTTRTFFEVLQMVAKEHTASSWNGTLVDSFSASAAMAVYNTLRDDLKIKFIAIINFRAEKYSPGVAMSSCVWKFVK